MNRRVTAVTVAIMALALAVGVSGASAASKTVNVGIEATLSGASPLPGYAEGGEAYFNYMDAHGGFDGYKVKYYVKDTADESAQTLSVTQQLVNVDHVQAIEAFASIPAAVLVPKRETFKVPMVQLSDGDQFAPGPQYQYVGAPSYHGMWEYAFKLAKTYFHKKTVALAYDDNAFGEPLSQVAGKVKADGLTLKASVPVPGDLTSGFSAYAARLKASGAQVVVDSDVPEIFTGLVKAAEAIGYNPIWLTNWGGEGPAVEKSLGSEMKHVYCVDFLPPVATSKSPAEALFKKVVGKAYPSEVTDPFAAQGWNNAALIGYGIAKAAKQGAVTANSINAALEKVNGVPIGLMPKVTIDSSSHISPTEMLLLKWNGKELVGVTPFTQIAS